MYFIRYTILDLDQNMNRLLHFFNYSTFLVNFRSQEIHITIIQYDTIRNNETIAIRNYLRLQKEHLD